MRKQLCKPRKVACGTLYAGTAPCVTLRRFDTPCLLGKTELAQCLVLEIFEKRLSRQTLNEDIQRIGCRRVVTEFRACGMVRLMMRMEERTQPIGITDSVGIGFMTGRHHQHISDGHFLNQRMHIAVILLGEIRDDTVFKRNPSFIGKHTDGGGNEGF